jgi:WhiB family redox-sensing transcriptional regulator
VSHYQGSVPETPRATDWRDEAACRGEDPDQFFASEVTPSGQAAIRHAKVICWRCPVMQECGQWAFRNREPFGVYGGVSEKERRRILRRRGVRLAEDPDAAETRAAS